MFRYPKDTFSASSGVFQEIEGESEERRRARLNHHMRTQQRMVCVSPNFIHKQLFPCVTSDRVYSLVWNEHSFCCNLYECWRQLIEIDTIGNFLVRQQIHSQSYLTSDHLYLMIASCVVLIIVEWTLFRRIPIRVTISWPRLQSYLSKQLLQSKLKFALP